MSRGHQYCTFFDSGYLPAGLALHDSLKETLPTADCWVLCLDNKTYTVLTALDRPDLHPVRLEELETYLPSLKEVKGERSRAEYYFTCKPALLEYLLDTKAPARLTYLDADLYFFQGTDEFPEGWDESPVVVHAHNFPSERAETADRVGRYNAGFVSVRNDETGLACVRRWRTQCLEWCFDRVEENRYADQKYLNEWPDRWDAEVLKLPGIGTARWNLERWSVSVDDGKIFIDDEPLVFYHFEGLQRLTNRIWDPHASLSDIVEEVVYRPYIRHRLRLETTISRSIRITVSDDTYRLNPIATGNGPFGNFARTIYRIGRIGLAGLRGDLIFFDPSEYNIDQI